MFPVAKLAALAFAASSVSSAVLPRSEVPAGWTPGYLEDYDTYHTRYLALNCHSKHGTKFFESCCHPLLATESLNSHRPAYCTPRTLSSHTHTHNPSSDSEEDCDYEDEDEDGQAFDTRSMTSPASSSGFSPAIVYTNSTEPAPSPASEERTSTTVYSGGYATYFYQEGNPGACGTVHKDGDMIAAIDIYRYGNTGVKSSQCNKKVKITNTHNHKSVTVTIADACPGCPNGNSMDLSEGAFEKIADLSEGIVAISWVYV